MHDKLRLLPDRSTCGLFNCTSSTREGYKNKYMGDIWPDVHSFLDRVGKGVARV